MSRLTLIHGMANKPPYAQLLQEWIEGVSRDQPPRGGEPPIDNPGVHVVDAGVDSDMVYWADVLYDRPEVDKGSTREAATRLERTIEGFGLDRRIAPRPPRWRQSLKNKDEREFVASLERVLSPRMEGYLEVDRKTKRRRKPRSRATREELVLPDFIQEPLMETLLRDVHHYLYNTRYKAASDRPEYEVRTELRRRFVEGVGKGAALPPPHVVVSHSMGTIIAYDCLRNVPDCPAIDVLITLGSPLGLEAVQDKLKPEGAKRVDYPPKVTGAWINVYDHLDPVVGFDPKFANDYKRDRKKAVIDISEPNWGKWRHNIIKYLSGPKLRGELRRALGLP